MEEYTFQENKSRFVTISASPTSITPKLTFVMKIFIYQDKNAATYQHRLTLSTDSGEAEHSLPILPTALVSLSS